MPEQDVTINIKSGCGICGSTDKHTHPYPEWKAALEAAVERWKENPKWDGS